MEPDFFTFQGVLHDSNVVAGQQPFCLIIVSIQAGVRYFVFDSWEQFVFLIVF